ncbi:MAG: sulfatase [Erythrobacter sp.]|nr:sulfatase [Erythrobacter sp.]
MTRRIGRTLAAGAAMLALLQGCAVTDQQLGVASASPAPVVAPVEQQRPNVLLIIADDMNTRLGAYGASVATPNVDAFAASAVQFDRAYTQFPICGTSRASFLTGLRPNTIGRDAIWERYRCTQPDIVTLPEYFRDHGYYSARVGKVFHQGVPSDIGRDGDDDDRAWNEAINPRGYDKDVEDLVVNATPGLGLGRANAWLATDAGDDEHTDGMVAAEAIRIMRERQGQPFFLAVGFYRPHVPEIVPAHWFDQYPVDQVQLAHETPESLTEVPEAATNTDVPNLGMSELQQRQMISAYQAATSHMDRNFGLVMAELDRLGLADNTIVMFIGDHGFMLGEHGQWQKTLLWEESLHVPMLVRAPGASRPGRVERLVEMLDIYPTLVGLAGLEPYARNEGRDLAPLLVDHDAPWDHPALSQLYGARSVRTDRWRYNEFNDAAQTRQLFDHRADPGEHRNLAYLPEYAATVAQLQAQLPAGDVGQMRRRTLMNAQVPPRPGAPRSRPEVNGCENLESLIG